VGRVATILVNWNGLRDTLACIESLAVQSYGDCAIIVVDNGSTEDPSLIAAQYPEVVLIRNRDNLGFCGGANIGIRKAAEMRAEYCWILNNDTEVAPDCLARLVEALDDDADLAAVAHPIFYFYNRRLQWFAGGVFHHGLPKHRGFMRSGCGAEKDEISTEFLTGCSFLARTSVLQELEGFDENYFCYVEDVDLSVRIKDHGYRIGYVPEALVWHKVSRSTGSHAPVKLYYKHRNMFYFLRKFQFPIRTKLRWWLISARFLISLLLKHRRPKSAGYLLLGLIHGAIGRVGPFRA
jgi:GT2 family glycosyltransferase